MNITRQGHSFDVVDLDDAPAWEQGCGGEGGFWPRFADGRWEPEVLDLVAKLSPGRTFVDIGAWVGAISLWADAHEAKRIVSVECDRIALPMLKANLANNCEGYLVLPLAVWTEVGETSIAPRGDSCTRVGEGSERTACSTLPTLWKTWGLGDAVVKIDIEGAETPVLNQDHAFLAEQGCELILSTHPWAKTPDCIASESWDSERVDEWTYHLWPSG